MSQLNFIATSTLLTAKRRPAPMITKYPSTQVHKSTLEAHGLSLIKYRDRSVTIRTTTQKAQRNNRMTSKHPPGFSNSIPVAFFMIIFIHTHSAGADDAGDSFTNNLLTDLAPIVALFGEQVFCSQYFPDVHSDFDPSGFQAVSEPGLFLARLRDLRHISAWNHHRHSERD